MRKPRLQRRNLFPGHRALAFPAVQSAVKRNLLKRAQKVTIGATVDAEQNVHEPDFIRASISATMASEIGTHRFSQSLGLKPKYGISSTRMAFWS